MFEYGSGWSGWGLVGMWLMALVFWSFIASVLYLAVTSGSRRLAHDQGAGAWGILEERLAKGGIDDDGYRQVREFLEDENRVPVGGRRS